MEAEQKLQALDLEFPRKAKIHLREKWPTIHSEPKNGMR
jgi:hypothetical protein